MLIDYDAQFVLGFLDAFVFQMLMFQITKGTVRVICCFQGFSMYFSSSDLVISLQVLLTFIKTSDYMQNFNFHQKKKLMSGLINLLLVDIDIQ